MEAPDERSASAPEGRGAELGVLFLMFMIGLELSAERLWALRRWVFGAGSAQLLASAVAIGVVAWSFGNAWPVAVVLGGGQMPCKMPVIRLTARAPYRIISCGLAGACQRLADIIPELGSGKNALGRIRNSRAKCA